MEAGARQLGSLTNRHYAQGLRIKVPRGVTRVKIPRTAHYAPTVFMVGGQFKPGQPQAEKFEDQLQPCTVKRGVFGWGLHKCPYHLVYLQEEERKGIVSYRSLKAANVVPALARERLLD